MKINPIIVVFGLIVLLLIVFTLAFPVPMQESLSNNISSAEKSSLPNLGAAPELTGTQGWINSEPLKIEELKGKVVMIDFWTYSCINCIRTLPYLKSWDEKYRDDGLVIIGVHTPEFEFEKDYDNVKTAVDKYEIKYPVVQDNNYETWKAYRNNYWPRKYLIDKEGNIRYDHIGEGGYEETEEAIVQLLKETGKKLEENMTEQIEAPEFSKIGTPEIYLGYKFTRTFLGNLEGFIPDQVVDYKPKKVEENNRAYLEGKWLNNEDNMQAVENSKLSLLYTAKDVNIVASGTGKVEILIDEKYLDETNRGDDVVIEGNKSVIYIDGDRLYNVVSSQDYNAFTITLVADPGIKIYILIFG